MSQPEYPDQDYIVGAKIRLIVRFEEFSDKGGKVASASAATFVKPSNKLKGTKDSPSPLSIQDDPAAPQGITRKILLPPGGPTTTPQLANGSTDGYTFVLGGIIPQTADVNLNGPRTADTAKVQLRYLDCPIDPRTVRSCAIEIYIGTLTQQEFEQGNGGATRPGTNEPLNAIPDTYTDANGTQRTNLRFQGWVDNWDVDWPNEDQPVVNLDCRDQTTVFIEQVAPPKLVLDAKLPLDQAVLGYLSNFPQFAGTSVEYRPSGATPPVLADALNSTAFKPTLGPVASKGGGSDKLSVWDYLTDVCGAVGHMVVVEGTNVVIERVRTITGSEFPARSDDPYKPRSLPSGLAQVRRLIYGRNIESMKTTRKFAKSAPTNIEVRCWNPAKKKVLVSRFPSAANAVASGKSAKASAKPGSKPTSPQPGDGKEQKWLVLRVSGVSDQATLDIIAQGAYEQVGRNELQVEIKTYNLASFGGGNLDPDVLDMRAGDTFELLVNRDEDELASMTKIENTALIQSNMQTFMNAAGFDSSFGAAYAKAYADAGFQTTYKLKTLGIKWDVSEGISLEIHGANYMEVRLDQNLSTGAQS